MKKIGLCISCQSANYGTLLQAFATQHAIEKLGYGTEILEYSPGNDPHKRYTPGAFFQRNVAVKYFQKKSQRVAAPAEDESHMLNRKERHDAAGKFRNEYLHSFVRCEGFHHARTRSKAYDAVLVGSDQVWNPRMAASNFYTLRFVDEGVKRISYATSMGVASWPWYLRGEAREYLSKIDSISVREETASEIIRDITGRTVEVVCDPTALLTKEEWGKAIPVVLPKGSYFFCYFLGDCKTGKQMAGEMSIKEGLPVWGIMSNECVSDDTCMDRIITGASVGEFVNYIRGASFVFTDSFHGTMLSLIHEKPFHVFYRTRTNTPYQRNSRIDDLLKRFGIEDRLVTSEGQSPSMEMDYGELGLKLERFRELSCAYLKKALP